MKSNPALQTRIGFQNPAQLVWYAAHVLLGACTSSPLIPIRAGSPEIKGKRAVPAYEGFAGSPAIAAAANTAGYAAGSRFPGRPEVPAQAANGGYLAVARIPAMAASPAYPIGTAVPRFVPVPARPEQLEVLPVAATAKVESPKVDALKGWETAIEIIQSGEFLTVVAELPVYGGVAIVGSNKLVIGEITPSTLQATEFLQPNVSSSGIGSSIAFEPAGATLESVLYQNMLLCEHAVNDSIRNGINCKRITATLYPSSAFDPSSDDLQLAEISTTSSVSNWWDNIVSPNTSYPSEAAWLAHVETTPVGSPERLFVAWVAANYPNQTVYFTHAGYAAVFDPELHVPAGGYFDNSGATWYLFRIVLRELS